MTIGLTDDSLLFIHCPVFCGPVFCFFFFFDNCSTFQFTFTLRINFSAENWSLFSMLSSGQEVRSEVYIQNGACFVAMKYGPFGVGAVEESPTQEWPQSPSPGKVGLEKREKKNPFTCLELDDSIFLVMCIK